LHGLRLLGDMGVRNVEAFGDSMLVIQQIKDESQCLDGILNGYRDECMSAIGALDSFSISHIPRGEMRGPTHWLSKHQGIMSREDCSQLKVGQRYQTYAYAMMGRPVKNLGSKVKGQMRNRPAKATQRMG
jgi:hypothetical protein